MPRLPVHRHFDEEIAVISKTMEQHLKNRLHCKFSNFWKNLVYKLENYEAFELQEVYFYKYLQINIYVHLWTLRY